MKIILTQNVPNLGSLGDEIQVKDGYARNFLLPQGMAMPAGGKNAREIQHRQHFLGKKRAEAIEAAQGESAKVAALELTVKVELQFKVVASEVVESSPGEEGAEPEGETPEGEGAEATEEGAQDGAGKTAEDATGDNAGDGSPPPAALDTSKNTGEASEQSTRSATETAMETTTETTVETTAESAPEKAGESTPETPSGEDVVASGGASTGSPEA